MNIFEEIIANRKPADKVYEDDKVIAIKDIYPHAPIHLLIIPKKQYKSLQDVPSEDLSIISHIAKVAQMLAKEFQIEDGYRLITNIGPDAGQAIFHLHFHLVGGKKLGSIA
ncbi:MAG: histidine triad nucleotide-binding protein [Chlamydiota bacterium]|jgi:histidine triad (HIT) family protein